MFFIAKRFNPVSYRRLLRETRDVCQCQSEELSCSHKTMLIFYFVRILSYPVLLLLLHLRVSAGLNVTI